MAQDPQGALFKYKVQYSPVNVNEFESSDLFKEIAMCFKNNDAFYKRAQSCLGNEYQIALNNKSTLISTKNMNGIIRISFGDKCILEINEKSDDLPHAIYGGLSAHDHEMFCVVYKI